MIEALISPREAASRAGWPERRVRQMIARNELRHLRVGRRIFLPENAIVDFIRLNMTGPDDACTGIPLRKADYGNR